MKKLRILVPTDLSDISNKAFFAAEELAKLTGSMITPLLAFSKTRFDGVDATEENARKDVTAVVSRLIDKKLIAEPIISSQKPIDAIVDNGKDFDIIIMSSHGKSGFNKLILGSVTEKVLRLSHTPVLVVKDNEKLIPMNRILLTTDFSENARRSYPLVNSLATLTGASVHMVYAVVFSATEPATHLEAYVRTKEKQFKADIDQYFGNIADRVTYEAPLTKKSAHEFLLNHLSDKQYNLVMMSTLGHTGLDYIRMGSTTSNVVRHVDTNVLVTNPMVTTQW